MAKPELGSKRQCMSCGAKFYDLNKDPAICPKCGTVFQAVALSRVAAPVVALPDVAAESESLSSPHAAMSREAESARAIDTMAGRRIMCISPRNTSRRPS